jgi:hypothetical protein
MPVPEVMAAKERTREAHRHLLTGLKYIPDDKLDWVPLGKAKTPRLIALECAGAYKMAARMVRGEPIEWAQPDAAAYPTRESVVEALNAGLAEFEAALDGLTAEQLAEKRPAPWGVTTVGVTIGMAFWHSVYHDGQLNYIQTLWGDLEMHFE